MKHRKARVYIGQHIGHSQYFLGWMNGDVFVEDVAGECPHISASSVEVQNEKGEWVQWTSVLAKK